MFLTASCAVWINQVDTCYRCLETWNSFATTSFCC